ncbi:hypothetical protein GN244_ATG03169 [Phytophthora infestans]|uniref:RxLR effector protein n=2 Tax=Phytophthora infestans TaxID=4787 RepID=A0A833SQQ8_PHYIN|nr:hypothetical protein GN244_ATG03169 [Phytophthora infestans]
MRGVETILTAVLCILCGTTDAAMTSDETIAASVATKNGVLAKRFLRAQGPPDEERGRLKDVFEKVKRLARYNKWIFSDKSPDWVDKKYPQFSQGYEKFWENRLVGGGKYA